MSIPTDLFFNKIESPEFNPSIHGIVHRNNIFRQEITTDANQRLDI